jgi:hypothetical protein
MRVTRIKQIISAQTVKICGRIFSWPFTRFRKISNPRKKPPGAADSKKIKKNFVVIFPLLPHLLSAGKIFVFQCSVIFSPELKFERRRFSLLMSVTHRVQGFGTACFFTAKLLARRFSQ